MTEPTGRPTPFHSYQESRGARFGTVGGWQVPLSFESGEAGRIAARAGAGLFDLTPYGRIKVTGKDRVSLLQRISTNDLRPLEAGSYAPTVFTTPKGRIVDRALVFDRGDSLLLVTSPSGRVRLRSWIQRYVLADDVHLTDITNETAAFALVGPASSDLIKPIAGVGAGAVAKGRYLGLDVADIVTLIAPFDPLPQAWLFLAEAPGIRAVLDHVVAMGESRALAPLGEEDVEVLRVEAGIPKDGHELTEEWNPWEAGLEESLSSTKGCYTGQEVIARLKTYDKVQRTLVGLTMGPLEPPPLPTGLYARSEGVPGIGSVEELKEIGTLTSAVRSDKIGETIGLGFVRQGFIEAGSQLAVGEGRAPAIVASLPFA